MSWVRIPLGPLFFNLSRYFQNIFYSNIVKFEIFKTVKVCGDYDVHFFSVKSTGVPYRVTSLMVDN